MDRNQRLNRIRALRRISETQAASGLAEARKELAGARNLLATLDRHRGEYLRAVGENEIGPCPAEFLQLQRTFLRSVQNAIRQQRRRVVRDLATCQASQKEWQHQYARRRALEELVERLAREVRRQGQHQEQRVTDDLGATRPPDASRKP